MLGGHTQRHLAECGKILFAEKILGSRRRSLAKVDLFLAETPAELLWSEIDQLDLVCPVQHRVRHRLAHGDAPVICRTASLRLSTC